MGTLVRPAMGRKYTQSGMADVVLINHDPDVLDALAAAVEGAGFIVAARHAQGTADELAAFIREQDPRVVIFDLGPPPLEPAIQKCQELCQLPGAHRPYVLTTSTVCELPPHPCMLETVLLKPFTLDDVMAAVQRAMRR